MDFQRFNVFSDEKHILDFVIPVNRIQSLMDDQWEVEEEAAVESIMRRLGVDDPVALFDIKFSARVTAELKKSPVETYLFGLTADNNSDFDFD